MVVDCGDGVLTGRIMEKTTWWLQRDGRGGGINRLAQDKARARKKDYKTNAACE